MSISEEFYICNSVTVNVIIFAGGKFRENVGKTFHVGVIVSPEKHSCTLGSLCLASVCPSVCLCLSGSHTFLVVTHSYVSQATPAFLGMLPLCSQRRQKLEKRENYPHAKISTFTVCLWQCVHSHRLLLLYLYCKHGHFC